MITNQYGYTSLPRSSFWCITYWGATKTGTYMNCHTIRCPTNQGPWWWQTKDFSTYIMLWKHILGCSKTLSRLSIQRACINKSAGKIYGRNSSQFPFKTNLLREGLLTCPTTSRPLQLIGILPRKHQRINAWHKGQSA